MTPRWKKATYTTIAGLGLFAGAAGIAGAATGKPAPPAGATQTSRDCTDGATTGVDCEDGPTDNEPAYTSSITVADTGEGADDATEAAALAKLATVTSDQASQAALATVPGTVIKVDLGNEHGSVVYSVEIRTDAGVVDVKVDAGNGKVLAQEADRSEPDGSDTGEANGRSQDD